MFFFKRKKLIELDEKVNVLTSQLTVQTEQICELTKKIGDLQEQLSIKYKQDEDKYNDLLNVNKESSNELMIEFNKNKEDILTIFDQESKSIKKTLKELENHFDIFVNINNELKVILNKFDETTKNICNYLENNLNEHKKDVCGRVDIILSNFSDFNTIVQELKQTNSSGFLKIDKTLEALKFVLVNDLQEKYEILNSELKHTELILKDFNTEFFQQQIEKFNILTNIVYNSCKDLEQFINNIKEALKEHMNLKSVDLLDIIENKQNIILEYMDTKFSDVTEICSGVNNILNEVKDANIQNVEKVSNKILPKIDIMSQEFSSKLSILKSSIFNDVQAALNSLHENLVYVVNDLSQEIKGLIVTKEMLDLKFSDNNTLLNQVQETLSCLSEINHESMVSNLDIKLGELSDNLTLSINKIAKNIRHSILNLNDEVLPRLDEYYGYIFKAINDVDEKLVSEITQIRNNKVLANVNIELLKKEYKLSLKGIEEVLLNEKNLLANIEKNVNLLLLTSVMDQLPK